MRGLFRKILKKSHKFDRLLFWAPVACALILLLAFTQDKAAFAAIWRSPLALLADRSPGSRDAKALYNTKPGHRSKPGYHVKPGFGLPQERVLAATRERGSPLDDFLFPAGLPLDPFGDNVPLGDSLGLPGLTAPRTSSTPFPGGGGLPSVFGAPGDDTPLPAASDPPGTPGPPDVPGLVPPIVTDTPPGAVPEPSTWAMMILGFGAISGAMRRSRGNGRRLALSDAS